MLGRGGTVQFDTIDALITLTSQFSWYLCHWWSVQAGDISGVVEIVVVKTTQFINEVGDV